MSSTTSAEELLKEALAVLESCKSEDLNIVIRGVDLITKIKNRLAQPAPEALTPDYERCLAQAFSNLPPAYSLELRNKPGCKAILEVAKEAAVIFMEGNKNQ